MGQCCLAERRVLPVMEKIRLRSGSPKLSGEELGITREESWRTRGLIHIQGLDIGVFRARGDVMKLEVGEGWDVDDTTTRFQSGLGERVV